jgi:hypothetical protein
MVIQNPILTRLAHLGLCLELGALSPSCLLRLVVVYAIGMVARGDAQRQPRDQV